MLTQQQQQEYLKNLTLDIIDWDLENLVNNYNSCILSGKNIHFINIKQQTIDRAVETNNITALKIILDRFKIPKNNLSLRERTALLKLTLM